MDYQEYLIIYKANLKTQVAEDLEDALEKVQRIILHTSERKNEILQLEGRYFQIEEEVLKGIVDERDRVLRINRIRAELIEFIDRISYSDIDEQEDPQFLEFQSQYELSETNSGESNDDVVEKGRNAPEDIPEIEQIIPETDDAKGIEDLELFSEMNRPLLVFYPKIYREIRSHIIRNDPKDKTVGSLISSIEQNLDALQVFQQKVNTINANLKNIRKHSMGKIFDLRFKKFKNYAFDLEFSSVSDIQNQNRELELLYREIEGLGLMKEDI